MHVRESRIPGIITDVYIHLCQLHQIQCTLSRHPDVVPRSAGVTSGRLAGSRWPAWQQMAGMHRLKRLTPTKVEVWLATACVQKAVSTLFNYLC
jgi:hypothetical protein